MRKRGKHHLLSPGATNFSFKKLIMVPLGKEQMSVPNQLDE